MAPSSTWEVGPPLDLARNCYHRGERNQREIIWEILPSLGWSPTGKFNRGLRIGHETKLRRFTLVKKNKNTRFMILRSSGFVENRLVILRSVGVASARHVQNGIIQLKGFEQLGVCGFICVEESSVGWVSILP